MPDILQAIPKVVTLLREELGNNQVVDVRYVSGGVMIYVPDPSCEGSDSNHVEQQSLPGAQLPALWSFQAAPSKNFSGQELRQEFERILALVDQNQNKEQKIAVDFPPGMGIEYTKSLVMQLQSLGFWVSYDRIGKGYGKNTRFRYTQQGAIRIFVCRTTPVHPEGAALLDPSAQTTPPSDQETSAPPSEVVQEPSAVDGSPGVPVVEDPHKGGVPEADHQFSPEPEQEETPVQTSEVAEVPTNSAISKPERPRTEGEWTPDQGVSFTPDALGALVTLDDVYDFDLRGGDDGRFGGKGKRKNRDSKR